MCFRRKSKEIVPNLNIKSKEIVVFQKFKKGRIYFGTKIKIPRNFALAFCSNNQVLDILYEGETVLDIKVLPKLTKKFGLYKVDKKGRSPKYFETDAYFINLNEFENFKWETSDYAELEDKEYGEYKAYCFGALNFKITAPAKLLNYLLKLSESIYPDQVEKIIINYINERIVRILNKANPTAKNLYLKNQEIVKLIYEKLSDLLSEIGIDLIKITLAETRFPPKILSDLKSTADQPAGIRGWGKVSFEDWHNANPFSTEKQKKPKFVTITPTGKNGPFFKESMAPYFFDEDEIKEESQLEEKIPEPIWKGIDEKTLEEQSKKLVDLDDTN